MAKRKMAKRCVFILSVSSDIGHALALEYLNDGYEIIGTYRNRESVADLAEHSGMQLLYCDIASSESIRSMINAYRALSKPWDIFVSSVGTMEPIGPFFSQDFDAWEQSVVVNSIAQIRVLHGLYAFRRQEQISNAVFFAGGGTNSVFTNYSAYVASKLLLIKMCELLDDENRDLNTFIIGPGFRRTKIHRQTFKNPVGAGSNLRRTRELFRLNQADTSYKDIYQFINWGIAQGKNVVSGRNFSIFHDRWDDGDKLARQLRENPDKFKLRRVPGKKEA